MRSVEISELGDRGEELARSTVAEDEPVALVDGDEGIAWIVSHHEYARLIAMAHHGKRVAEQDAPGKDIAREFEEKMAADMSLQRAWADRHALWTIKG